MLVITFSALLHISRIQNAIICQDHGHAKFFPTSQNWFFLKIYFRTFISHRKINFSKFYKWVIFRSMKWYQLFEKYQWNLGAVPPEKIAQKEVKFPKNAIFHFFSCSAVHWKCNHLSRSGPYKIFADTMKWHQWLQKYQCN